MDAIRETLIAALVIVCAAAGAEAQNLPPGIAAEKPAEGRSVEITQGPHKGRFMVPYTHRIAGNKGEVIAIRMTPIPGGEFAMGSPAGEKDRGKDEGPQVRVRVEPFWMGVYEVTWGQYEPFLAMYNPAKTRNDPPQARADDADAVSVPSQMWEQGALPILHAMGMSACDPASGVGELGARQYTKYISIRSGAYFRLPTEAEWEYAARAGTTTAYYFGDDPAQLGEHAWYFENSEWEQEDRGHPALGSGYRPVGQKKPNPWGLFDVYGNVSEWVIDQHDAEQYAQLSKKAQPVSASDAIRWPTQRWGRVTRGGHWDSDAKDCRSASRLPSHKDWSAHDPDVPQSPWHHTEYWMGFRVVRPLIDPDHMVAERFWQPYGNDVVGYLQQGKAARVKIARAPAPADGGDPCPPTKPAQEKGE